MEQILTHIQNNTSLIKTYPAQRQQLDYNGGIRLLMDQLQVLRKSLTEFATCDRVKPELRDEAFALIIELMYCYEQLQKLNNTDISKTGPQHGRLNTVHELVVSYISQFEDSLNSIRSNSDSGVAA